MTAVLHTTHNLPAIHTNEQSLFEVIQSYKTSKSWPELNQLLENTDLTTATTVEIIGKLRYTFENRKELPYWIKFRDSAAQILRKRGKDPGKVLVGLYDIAPRTAHQGRHVK